MPKTKRINTKKKSSLYIVFTALIISIAALIFNDFGLLKLIRLQQQQKKLEHSLGILLSQQEKITSEINKLQTNNEYIKKIAREKFMMVLPGEKVYRVQEIKQY